MSEQRRGYNVSEPPRSGRPPKRFRSHRDDDADYYYRPSGDERYHYDYTDDTESSPPYNHPRENGRNDGRYADKGRESEERLTSLGQRYTDMDQTEAPSLKESVDPEESELDEFGRKRPRPSGTTTSRWPPDFEKQGSKYVLDNRSGMFYEADSNFFYDPKTKLYYSHEKQGYFRHRLADNGKSVYDKVEHLPTAESSELATTSTSVTDKQMMVPAISINLKTKSLGKKGRKKKDDTGASRAVVPLPSAIPKTKETEADLAKWSQRQTELKAGDRDLSRIPKTAKGEPICSLCKRKFPTLEKLFYHEQVSELHKTNLAKQASVRRAATAGLDSTKPSYVDRAEQRRILQGPETPLATPAAEPTASAVRDRVDPKETLNESNIGNQMLKKLGWQQGEGLGRRGTEASNSLQQDWERIEQLAASNSGANK